MDDYFPFVFLLRLSSGLRCRMEVSEITTDLLSLSELHSHKNGIFTTACTRVARATKYLQASFNRLSRNVRLYRYGGFVRRQQPPRTYVVEDNALQRGDVVARDIKHHRSKHLSGREISVVINTLPENTLLLRFVSNKMNYHRQLLSSEIRQEGSDAR